MKRETGENPVRTRHRVLQAEATDPLGEPGREQMCQSNKPGDLPFAVQERRVQATRNWRYEKDDRLFFIRRRFIRAKQMLFEPSFFNGGFIYLFMQTKARVGVYLYI